jgi:hypothetical protein
MSKIKLQDLPEDLQEILKDNGFSLYSSEYKPDVKCEEDDEWIDDGKFSSKTIIFKYDGKHYCAAYSRDGSYFTSYNIELQDEEFFEVTLKSKTVQYWG